RDPSASSRAHVDRNVSIDRTATDVGLLGRGDRGGGACSARSMEPFTSAKRTVTCFRSPSRVRIFSARCFGVEERGSSARSGLSPRCVLASEVPHFPRGLLKRRQVHWTAYVPAKCRTARVRLLLGLSSSRIVKWFVFTTGIKSPGR